MRNYILLAVIMVGCFSCKKTLLGEEEVNTPEHNFELFWNDFDQHYGLFQARDWNWDSIYQVYQPQVNAQTTDEELWHIFKEMIAYLDDSHTFLYAPENNMFFASGSEEDELVATEFSLDLLIEDYLENVVNLDLSGDLDEHYLFGKLKNKDIGYIYLSDLESDDEDFMDDVLEEIGKHKAIILDIRNNTGGSDEVGAEIANRFADGVHFVYTVQTRNGSNYDDFSEKIKFYTEVLEEEDRFEKPLILLTDKITVSAAETMLFYMKSFDLVTQIGDTSAGDFSDIGMRRFLPNGWQYQYSIMMYLQADGQSLDGIGHIPDIYVRNSVTDIQTGNDRVLKKAIDFLFEEYGIQ